MCDLMIGGDNMIKELVNKIVKEEYGGCDPAHDETCILKAIVSDGKEGYGARIIYVWVVGKWRPVGRTGYRGLPSLKAVQDVINTIRINTGGKRNEQGKWIGGTFGDKEIMLQFINFNISADTLR